MFKLFYNMSSQQKSVWDERREGDEVWIYVSIRIG
jgi:hypothetical protein